MLYMKLLLAADFITEFFDLLWAVFGIGLVALVFWVGNLLVNWLREKFSKVTDALHGSLNRRMVDCMIKGILVVAALIVGNIFHLELSDVVNSVIPIGDFNSIAEAFAAEPDKWPINIAIGVLAEQLFMSFVYFIPFFGFDLVVNFIESLICRKETSDGPLGAAISFVTDIAVLMSVNAIVMCSGMTFFQIMHEFLKSIQLSDGVLRWAFLAAIFVMMLFFVVRDLFSSDIIMAVLGVNVAAVFFEIGVTDKNRAILFGMAILCGMIAKLVRKRIVPEESEDSDTGAVWYGIGVIVVSALVTYGVLWLLNTYVPGFALQIGLM